MSITAPTGIGKGGGQGRNGGLDYNHSKIIIIMLCCVEYGSVQHKSYC
jgi:hypothetical protein